MKLVVSWGSFHSAMLMERDQTSWLAEGGSALGDVAVIHNVH
jgi:hypothetical protein